MEITTSYSGQHNSEAFIGGFVAENQGTIQNCCASGNIEGLSASLQIALIGGFVCKNGGDLSNSYADCNIKASVGIGGFAGESVAGANITKSFSVGSITFQNVAASGYSVFCGITEVGATFFKNYHSNKAIVQLDGKPLTTNETNSTATSEATLQSKDFLTDTLYFSEEIWQFSDNAYPKLK